MKNLIVVKNTKTGLFVKTIPLRTSEDLVQVEYTSSKDQAVKMTSMAASFTLIMCKDFINFVHVGI